MPLADPSVIGDEERLEALRAVQLLDTPAEDAFDRWTKLAAQLVGVPTTLISLVDEHRQFFKSAVGLREPWASRRETPLSHSFCQHAVASGQTLAIEDARTHPLVHDNLAIPDLGVVAYAGAPLKDSTGQTLGVLCAIDGAPRQWSARELATLEALSQSVMNEIKLRTTIDRLAKSDAEARRQALLLRSIVDQMDDALVAVDMGDRALLANDAARRLRHLHATGELSLFDQQGTQLDWSQRPLARALRGETLRGFVLREQVPRRPPRWLSVSARPLLDDAGAQIGALSEARDITAVQQAQDELRTLNQRLHELSFADELTGIYNRRGFLALVEQELKVAIRAQRSALIFYVDLDGMKQINDRLGHEAGDAALLEAASVLRNTFRESDIPARMGGDEFAVFAIEATEAHARQLAERLQAHVAQANRELDRPYTLAMSCGWTSFNPRTPLPLPDLLAAADAAMYEQKRARREAAKAARP